MYLKIFILYMYFINFEIFLYYVIYKIIKRISSFQQFDTNYADHLK